MRRIMLVGAAGAGRRSLAKALFPCDISAVQHVMAAQYCGPFVFPPPEFLENRRFYHMLITLGAECDTLFFVQSATSAISVFPPGFACTFNRTVVGIASKSDAPNADTDRATRLLRTAGVQDIRLVSTVAACPALEQLRQEFFSPTSQLP